MTMNILIQDFCNSISESPLPKIKSKVGKRFCLTKPDARSSGGEEDWLASGQLADGDIKNDLHSLVDFTKKEDQYKTEATTGELGTKNKDVKFFLLTLIRSPPVEKKM